MSWLSRQANIDDLVARKKYAQAVELLKGELQRGARDPRLRLQLADVLVLAGKGKEAVPILFGLADEFALDGFAAKAISVLKKIQRIEPGRAEVDRKLAGLIKQKSELSPPPVARPAVPVFDAEEISLDLGVRSAEAPVAPAVPPPAPQVARPETAMGLDGLGQAAGAYATAAAAPPAPADEAESLGDELMGMLDQLLSETGAAKPAPSEGRASAVASPLFSDFTEDELVEVIRGLELVSFEPGDIVITEGEAGDSLFVLTSGHVKAFVRNPQGKSVQVRVMEEGAFFGEISILSGRPRTATVTAGSRCELLELDRATLDGICRTRPRVREVLQRFYDERVRNEQEARIRRGGA
jgi:hypothetical protein